jgi:hypothetical protein
MYFSLENVNLKTIYHDEDCKDQKYNVAGALPFRTVHFILMFKG